MPQYLYDGMQPLVRTLVVGSLAYVGIVLFLRASGKRTVSKWNAFDLVVTVAVGSSFATVLLSKDVSLSQGLVGLALLVLLQFFITWLSVRAPAIEKMAKAEPSFLLYDGKMLREALLRERVTEAELLAALRSKGMGDVSEAGAVVLETDGTFSIIPREKFSPGAVRPTFGNIPSPPVPDNAPEKSRD